MTNSQQSILFIDIIFYLSYHIQDNNANIPAPNNDANTNSNSIIDQIDANSSENNNNPIANSNAINANGSESNSNAVPIPDESAMDIDNSNNDGNIIENRYFPFFPFSDQNS